MAEMSNFIYDIGEISGNAIFIDGTKIEACANKYTFVWKKAVTKNLAKLLIKLADFVSECEELYGIKLVYQNQVRMKHVKKLRKKLYALKQEENIEFVYGCGKRKTSLQRSIEKLEEYLNKLKEYTQKIHVCGERNSYSKTDNDATFMRMKEDAMGNGQLKAGYNVQHGVDSEYITWLTVGLDPTDTTTLIPFLKRMELYLKFKYEKIVADAGYESEENYVYLEGNGQLAFIKPSNYEISKLFNRQRKDDLERILSKEGCKLRVNRSIQAEGSFGELKEATEFRRFLCRGEQNVLAESILLAMAHNINKLHNKIQSERTGTHLFQVKESA
ncbi:MAG: transposase [Caulobacteraceae bacterium]